MARDRPDPYGFETLWRQYRACRRNKRTTVNALRFELNAEENLLALQQELRDHTYRPGPSICFVTDGPKPREVFAADFRDRIVHHLLVSWQEPVFEREFTMPALGTVTSTAGSPFMTATRRDTGTGTRRVRFANRRTRAWAPIVGLVATGIALAEMLAVRYGRDGRPLTDCKAAFLGTS